MQLFTDGHFNCDPHAGNLLVDNRRATELGPTPVLLDFGLCKRLSATERLAFCGLVHALAELGVPAGAEMAPSIGGIHRLVLEAVDASPRAERALSCFLLVRGLLRGYPRS